MLNATPLPADATTPRPDSRVVMIGVDAMSLAFVRANLDHLPVLRGLIETGAVKELTSPATHISASVWPTFATGEHPGGHGHYFPFQWDPARMKFRRTCIADFFDRLRFEPFWRSFAKAGVPTVAFDPGTPIIRGPSPSVDIFNWSYQSSGLAAATDPGLLRDIRKRFGRRPIGKEVTVPKTLRQGRRIRDDMIEALRRKTDATLWLMEKLDWRLFLAGFFEVHRAGHNLLVVDGDFGSPADPDALLAVYKAQDRELARLLDRVTDDRTTIVLFSLHGMAPNRAQDHFLQTILKRLNDAWLTERGVAAAKKKDKNLMSFLRENLPFGLQYSLAYLLGEHVQDWVVNRALVGGFDWSRTPSFRLSSGGEGYVRFNIKDREAAGYFEPTGGRLLEYAAWLKSKLMAIRVAGTGEPLFSEIIDGHALEPGARTDYLPDLILKYAPEAPVSSVSSPDIGVISAHLDTGRGGNHTGDAFVLAVGAGATDELLKDIEDIRDLRRLAGRLLGMQT